MPKTVDFTIDREFASMLVPQTDEELNRLEDSLLANGCLDSLKVWKEEGILIDGHTRKKICEKHDIPYTVEEISIPGGREAALQWVIDHQLGRRNLNDEQRTYFMGKELRVRVEAEEEKAKEAAKEAKKNPPAEANGQPETFSLVEKGEIVDELAKKYDVADKTILRAEKYSEALDSLPVKEKLAILTGEKKVNISEIVAKAPKKYKKRKRTAGKVKFPWVEFDKVAARFRRAIDEVAKSYDTKESNDHRSIRKQFNDLYEEIFGKNGWKAALEEKAK